MSGRDQKRAAAKGFGAEKRRAEPALPVDPGRLQSAFPELTDDDLAAYVAVTRRVLGDQRTRGATMRSIMEKAKQAQQRAATGEKLAAEETELVRYLDAVAKMQPR